MNARYKYIFLFLFVFLMLIASCSKKEDLPDVPYISFVQSELVFNPDLGIYDRAVLVFSYEDGNGDIGLTGADTIPPYDYNLLVDFYELQNGVWKKIVLRWYDPESLKWDTLNMNGRIPVLTPEGNYKGIKGEIYDTVFAYNFNSAFDTVKYRISILDRALNQSNFIESEPIFVPRAGQK